MKVVVNGNEYDAPRGMTVRELIEAHRLSVDRVAVELNRRLVRQANYDTALNEGDQIEIVTFVGGG